MVSSAATRVRFRGREISVRPGELLLRSLARTGLPLLQRSIRYHRPRAPFCGAGFCTNCLVRVNGEPNVRACRYVPRGGDRIRTENAWPSPAYDIQGLLDGLFPRGIDTLRGFRRPAWAGPLYQRVVRRLAGYGRIADEVATPPPIPSEPLETEVLVIGAGPAGRTAAERVAREGRSVTLLERGPVLAPPAGLTVFDHATAVFLPPPRTDGVVPFQLVVVRDPDRGLLFRSRHVVVAAGAYDASLLFAGNDRPGVLTGEGALALAGDTDEPPFRHALLVGGGSRAAELLDRFGTHVDAVMAPGAIAPEVTRRAAELAVALYPRTLLLAATGRSRVRRAHLASRGTGARFAVPADAVILAHRRLPHTQLLFQAGAQMEWRAGGGTYYPVIDPGGRTTVSGLWAIGEAAGYPDGVAAEASGVAAAELLLGRAGPSQEIPGRIPREAVGELEGYYRELLRQPRRFGKRIACACEDVLLDELEEAVARGFRGMEVVKRYTGLGTGLCQGRYCQPEALLVLSILERRPPSEVGYTTQRPPVVPVPIRALAELPPPDPETLRSEGK